jgi:LacI family transcriptional regulator
MSRRVTMTDVAREADVSLMTVSRVVNNKEGISELTRARVQEIVDRLGYRPSDIARGLATQRTGTLGLVVPDSANPFFSEVARGVEHLAYANGYNVFLCNTDEDLQRELAILRSLEEKRVDGVIMCSPRLDDATLREELTYHEAVVLINRALDDSNGICTLVINDEAGGQVATQHLLEAGHRQIGFIAGPELSYSGRQRAKGYRLALEQAGLVHDDNLVRHCTPMVDCGKESALDLLSHNPEITALFCYNDLVAVGALQASIELERNVPDDLAIVGFDDIPLALLVTPPLTTCHVPRYELGSRAMIMLLDYINGDPVEAQHARIQTKLVIRASAP